MKAHPSGNEKFCFDESFSISTREGRTSKAKAKHGKANECIALLYFHKVQLVQSHFKSEILLSINSGGGGGINRYVKYVCGSMSGVDRVAANSN